VHLVTLRNSFVGYVVPSKIHASIESGKRVLYVGSQDSDVHLLANSALRDGLYRQVDVGDVDGLVEALHDIEGDIVSARKPDGEPRDRLVDIDPAPRPASTAQLRQLL